GGEGPAGGGPPAPRGADPGHPRLSGEPTVIAWTEQVQPARAVDERHPPADRDHHRLGGEPLVPHPDRTGRRRRQRGPLGEKYREPQQRYDEKHPWNSHGEPPNNSERRLTSDAQPCRPRSN